VIIGFSIIGKITGGSDNKAAVENRDNVPLSDIKWDEIKDIYRPSSGSTELQKKEAWKNYNGKKIQGSGYVVSVEETLGTLQLEVSYYYKYENPQANALINLKDSSRSEAVKLKPGDEVTFQGILDDWSDISYNITLADGIIINELEKK
jgi:hypothetical protein